MDKKYLSKLTIGGNQYDLKDAEARQDIIDIKSSITGAMHWIGFTTTELEDGDTTNPIVIDNQNVTAVAGDVVCVDGDSYETEQEFVFNGTKWQKYGPAGSFKALAFKDSATGDITCAGTNAASAVSFSGTTSETVLKAIDDAAVAPSFSEGAFDAGSLPSFTEGTFSAGTLPSFTEGTFSAGTLPSFTEGEFTQGTLPSFTEGTFSAGTLPSLGAATTGTFTTEGVIASVDEANELLTFSAASTSSAVTAQGTFDAGSLPSKAADTWNAGTLPTKASDTFSAGTLPSKDADIWSAGTLPSKGADTFSAGTLPSKAADTFDAGSAATFTTESVITGLGTATAAAQVFSGSTVSVTVS